MNPSDRHGRSDGLAAFFRDEPLWRTGLAMLVLYLGLEALATAVRTAWRTGDPKDILLGALFYGTLALITAAVLRARARMRAVESSKSAV